MNKVILLSELPPDFLIEGFALRPAENQTYLGKAGGHDVLLLLDAGQLQADQAEDIVVYVGAVESSQTHKPGNVLMTGSGEWLDRAFKVIDEMEQGGVVVDLTPSQDGTHLYLAKEQAEPLVLEWRDKKLSFLCLWMVGSFDTDMKAKLLTILRKLFFRGTAGA